MDPADSPNILEMNCECGSLLSFSVVSLAPHSKPSVGFLGAGTIRRHTHKWNVHFPLAVK